MKIYRSFCALCAYLGFIVTFAATALHADVIETKNGSRITGKVTQIDATVVTVNTDFAGDIKIKQGEIVSIMTDAPMNIRLDDGDVLQGTISNKSLGSPPGSIVITGLKAGEATDASLGKISRTWALKSKDPEVAKLERHWSFEAGMDVTGKTGNNEQLGTTYSFRATLASSRDALQLHTAYNRQLSNGSLSADQFKAGVDYQNNFHGRTSWYARDEMGFDHVRDINLSNIAAAGVGYDLIKTKTGSLTVRGGLSHRYEDHSMESESTVRDLGFDFGLINQWTFRTWSITSRIAYTPTFEDLSVYQIVHDSYVELPMASPHWKFRIGITNDYDSHPSAGLKQLDTTYYARLLLNWK